MNSQFSAIMVAESPWHYKTNQPFRGLPKPIIISLLPIARKDNSMKALTKFFLIPGLLLLLTSMMAYAELLLRQSEPGSPPAKAAEVLIREAERMADIVRKIGKITRYETTAYVGHQKIFDLDRAAETPSDSGAKS